MAQCKAKRKSDGKRCSYKAMKGKEYCGHHQKMREKRAVSLSRKGGNLTQTEIQIFDEDETWIIKGKKGREVSVRDTTTKQMKKKGRGRIEIEFEGEDGIQMVAPLLGKKAKKRLREQLSLEEEFEEDDEE
jgi:hypothetical protein